MSQDTPKKTTPVVRRRRRLSSVWLIPIVALGLAGWLVWKNQIDKGVLATITFETAEGLAAGKTEIRCRSVRVGTVEKVILAPDLKAVDVQVRIDPAYEELLRYDTRFWVVRPRVSTSAVSGLGTLITGAYIELEPGEGPAGASLYTGLEEPPVTSSNVPGLRLTLISSTAGSLSVGAPIYFRDFAVGKVERQTLSLETKQIKYSIYISEKYASLVNSRTRFWNTSGIDVTAGADGFKFRTPSFQAIVTGGASFFTPADAKNAPAVQDGDTFKLFDDETSARDSAFEPDQQILMFFDQSVRGLKRGAPVEFRGISLGRVIDISFKYSEPGDARVPVLAEISGKSFDQATSVDGTPGKLDLADAVQRGLRARLATGSLLTGALYIDLDLLPDAPPQTISQMDGYDVIPTVSSGLAQLELKVNAILAKIEALPLEDTLNSFGKAADEAALTLAEARGTLDELDKSLGEFEKLIAADSTQSLPDELNQTLAELRTSIESIGPSGAVQGDLRRTLDELRAALRAFESLSTTIDEKPNSLLFGRESSGDPIPRARR
ncbi:intermembrane transport protein PqiB [Haloferula rosea]|uniref:Intermembrane transport protein PqiB n=1 Tax=Haloferula rosea TaxID=490093 RepID=A0A934RAZ0_9BACT|nr:intermembrane transport protein PqiB [Haloferula rosea]MBK1826438.1 intermembrane transport protein PqiB [Haloferula rosea]